MKLMIAALSDRQFALSRFRPRAVVFASAISLALVLLPGVARAVKCLDDGSDAAQIAGARAAVDAACKCFSFDKHGKYVSCAAGVVNAQAAAMSLRKECTGTLKKIYANSVCGKPIGPIGPAVPCVSHSGGAGAKTGCAIKPLSGCKNGGITTRHACFASTTCLDAADTNGDLRIAAPGDSGNCAPGSFADNGDGTITDNGTGLIWEKLSDDGSIHDWDDIYTWADAAAVKVAVLNGGGGFAGHTDWRVPTVAELQTLIQTGSSPAIDAAFNTGCAPGCSVFTCSCTVPNLYWSASTSAGFGQYAWWVDFFVGFDGVDTKTVDHPVRAVRGGS